MKSTVLTSQAYEVTLAPHPTLVSLFKFTRHDAVGLLCRYEGKLTEPMDALWGTK